MTSSANGPSLPYKDAEFLESSEARPLRILAEYVAPLTTFQRENVSETIVFFGSARLTEEGPLGRYYSDARELSRRVSEWAQQSAGDQAAILVCSGGGGGIMEAANRGAQDAGGRTVGLNIGLPNEQRPNPYITPELSFEFRYFFMRKLWFAHLARAVVVFPGGFGTLDELSELLTLMQTQKLERAVPIFLYGSDYWNEILNFPALVKYGMISDADLALFQFVDTPDSAFEAIRASVQPPNPSANCPNFAGSRQGK